MPKIPVRYYRLVTDPNVEGVESNFGYVYKELEINVNEVVLVMGSIEHRLCEK